MAPDDAEEVTQVPCPECGEPMSENTDLCAKCILKQYDREPVSEGVTIEGDT